VYLGGIIVFGTNLVVTIVIMITAALFWRAGYFKNVEEAKYRMMEDNDEERKTNVE
jgi:cell division protein FtsI/penicillin-binding protein 2